MAIGKRVIGWAACLAVAAPHAWAGVCVSCHPAQSARQAMSAHAAALFRAQDHPLADAFPAGAKLDRSPKYHFQLLRSGGEFRTRLSDSENVMDLPMEWAFGAGRQAVTFVSRVDKDW